MTEGEVYDFLTDAIWTVLIGTAPVLALALAVGLIIAFFQALTQIQEMTLTFVPKIVVILIGVAATTPFIYSMLQGLSDRSFDAIASGGL
ncbi:flagellar biosynthesis protein FliQ [Roseivivax isoporae]|uniref:Flagellar biosynthetic protein FliQ n=1 Tax=Roseivivax isoporae LMG 25204 TaxID=1449351 RepID=X7F9Y0_9RHOB|nr:flagellar biosynthesis protein FliQ [Roseivivax isoporae]ETX28916.1 flagellar biosynthesis protein FliQ [Roseivivax isoporae LMG 25204]